MLSETIARAGSANIAKMTSTAIPLNVECNCLMPSEIAMFEKRRSENKKGGQEELLCGACLVVCECIRSSCLRTRICVNFRISSPENHFFRDPCETANSEMELQILVELMLLE